MTTSAFGHGGRHGSLPHGHRWRLPAIASAVAWVSCATAAVTLNDTLDCGLPGGGYARLKRPVEVSLLPFPIIHGRRARRRSSWAVEFVESIEGVRTSLSVAFSEPGVGLQAYADACAHLGSKHGATLAPRRFLLGERIFALPSQGWRGSVPPELSKASPALREAMAGKRLVQGVLGFVFVMPAHGGLVSEQPLQSGGNAWNDPFNAVYQSRSVDDGRTWSEPVITTESEIFEIGKAWREQCFLAVPVRYNGKPVQWPARCAADATPGKP